MAAVDASFIEEEVTSAGVEWSGANRVKRLEVGPVENAPHLTARDRMKQTYAVLIAVMLDIVLSFEWLPSLYHTLC